MKNENNRPDREPVDSRTQKIIMNPRGDLFPDSVKEIDEMILSESYRRLQMIYAPGQNICGTTDLDKLLKSIVEALVRSIKLERCFVATIDEHAKLKPLITHHIELSEDLPEKIGSSGREGVPEFPLLKDILTQVEQKHFRPVLDICDGDNNRAMKLLGIARTTFFERKKRYKL